VLRRDAKTDLPVSEREKEEIQQAAAQRGFTGSAQLLHTHEQSMRQERS